MPRKKKTAPPKKFDCDRCGDTGAVGYHGLGVAIPCPHVEEAARKKTTQGVAVVHVKKPHIYIDVERQCTVQERHSMYIGRAELLALLRANGYEVPDHASIATRVPGCGDWSNSDLPIDHNQTIDITWETTRKE